MERGLTMKTTSAPCSTCLANTEHNVLYFVDGRSDDWCDPHYDLLECAGCKDISLRLTLNHIDDTSSVHYFPSPASRKVPDWLYEGNIARPLARLLHEIYQAVRGGQFRLAIMGVRALIEQVMIKKVGDNGSFVKNLDAFQQAGYVSLVQRDALNDILDAGHAAIHRAYEPKTKDIQIALDITEGIMAAIFVHTNAAKELSERVPARPKKPSP
jgi:Domain of unknown function (DUF4145)